MNNKGFTLVELLATVVILGLVMGIATYGVISAIDSSKKKSEEVFVSKFVDAIESYLALKGDKLEEKPVEDGSSSEQKFVELNSFKLSDLASENLIDENKFINPRNKDENCYNENAVIRAFRDDQFVYYYYFDFKQLGKCLVDIDDENNEFVKKYESNSNEVASYAKSNNTDLDEEEILEAAVVDEVYESLSPGDYVSYTPSASTFTTDMDKTGYSITQTLTPNELTLWRVLNIKQNGEVDLISEYVSSKQIVFDGLVGYKNYVGYLNEIAAQYADTTYTVGSRHFGYDGRTTEFITDNSHFVKSAPWTCSTDDDGCSTVESQGGGDKGYLTDVNLATAIYGNDLSAYRAGTSKTGDYFIASRSYEYVASGNFSWKARVYNSGLGKDYVYEYIMGDFGDWTPSSAIRPIVTLKANLTCYSGDGKTKDNPCSIMR